MRLLCRLGFHKWVRISGYWDQCSKCPKKRVHYDDYYAY